MIGVALLGATGSIGTSTLAVLRQHRDRFRLVAVAVRSNWEALLPIIAEFGPRVCAIEDEQAALSLSAAMSRHHPRVEVVAGKDAATTAATSIGADVVVASATKALSGHSDRVGPLAVPSRSVAPRVPGNRCCDAQ